MQQSRCTRNVGLLLVWLALLAIPAVHGAAMPADGPRPVLAGPIRENGRVWLDGVPTLAWGTGRECTFIGALEAALAATELPHTYTDLMGWSGLAFRVRWYHGDTGKRWCPSSPVGEFPEEMTAIQEATGWTLRCEAHFDDPKMARFAPQIAAAIDASRPVLAYDPSRNMGVAYGYEDGGTRLLMRYYARGPERPTIPASELGPMLIFLSERRAPLPQRDALTRTLRTAVRNYRRKPLKWRSGQYWYGDRSFEAWMADLGNAKGLRAKDRDLLHFVNWWNAHCLLDARRRAVEFLRSHARLLDAHGHAALLGAAALYKQEVEILRTPIEVQTAFSGLAHEWTDAKRRRERRLLATLHKIETNAIHMIEKALPKLE